MFNILLKSEGYEDINLKYKNINLEIEDENKDKEVVDKEVVDKDTENKDEGKEDRGFKITNGRSISSNGGDILISENCNKESIDSVSNIFVNDVEVPLSEVNMSKSVFGDSGTITFRNLSYFNKEENILKIIYKDYKTTNNIILK